MILFSEDTRRVGAIGLCISLLACLFFLFLRWPPRLENYFWGALCLGVGAFYLYLILIRRRRIVTLLNGELVWNTLSFTASPVSAHVSEIRAYRVEPVYDTHFYRGTLVLRSSASCDLGNFSLEVHKRIFSAVAAINPGLEWQLIEQ